VVEGSARRARWGASSDDDDVGVVAGDWSELRRCSERPAGALLKPAFLAAGLERHMQSRSNSLACTLLRTLLRCAGQGHRYRVAARVGDGMDVMQASSRQRSRLAVRLLRILVVHEEGERSDRGSVMRTGSLGWVSISSTHQRISMPAKAGGEAYSARCRQDASSTPNLERMASRRLDLGRQLAPPTFECEMRLDSAAAMTSGRLGRVGCAVDDRIDAYSLSARSDPGK
jgi:hypothetical protein